MSQSAKDSHNETPVAIDHAISNGQMVAPDWQVTRANDGPVVATAIHDGHVVRESLQEWMALSEDDRRREEDPLTGVLTSVGDTQVRVCASRFEVDLNRPRDKAIALDPADSWGLEVWRETPPQEEIARSLANYDRFYSQMHELLDGLVERWGCVLLLDIHSYNHRRDGPAATPADPALNPEIDLGITTFDKARHGAIAERFTQALRAAPVDGRTPDVRANVRYDGGGHFPESLYARYGEKICAISLEYKKIYMDEWSAQADISVVEDFRAGLVEAVASVRGEFMPCR